MEFTHDPILHPLLQIDGVIVYRSVVAFEIPIGWDLAISTKAHVCFVRAPTSVTILPSCEYFERALGYMAEELATFRAAS